MRYAIGFVIALAPWVGALGAKAPTPPDGVPPEALKAVKGVLPKGWTATANGVTLTVKREKKVGYYNPIGLTFDYGDKEKPIKPTVIEAYEITLRFRPRVTAEAYEKLQKENKEIETKLEALRDGLRAARISHKFDDWLPDTPEQKKLVAEYRAAQKAMPYHRLPDVYTDTNSIDIDDSIRFPLCFADEEEAKECKHLYGTIRFLFKSHADK